MFNKALIAAALLSSLSASAVNAADGTINFTGTILASTCDINGGTGPANIAVPMGTYSVEEFSSSGAQVGSTPFTISLTNCNSGLTSATVLLEGTPNGANSDLLALTAAGGNEATEVGIGIYESTGALIKLNTASAPQTISSGTATFNFLAKYVSTSATVGEGEANGVASFTVQYS